MCSSKILENIDEEDVDSFLDVVADELEATEAEHETLKAELESARKKLAEFEEMQSSLQSALITASKSAEDIRNQSIALDRGPEVGCRLLPHTN